MGYNDNQDYNQQYNPSYNNQTYDQQYGQSYTNQTYDQQYGQTYNNQAYNQQYGPAYDNQAAGYQPYGQSYGNVRTISPEAYNLVIGGTLLYGFLVNCFMIQFCFDSIASLFMGSPIMFYVIYFAMAFTGTMMVNKSTNPVISFIGYNLFVVPLGLIIALVVNTYAMAGYSTTITAAFAITAIVTLIMMFVSSVFPRFFLNMGRTLTVTLLVTILIELIMSFIGFDLGIIDYIVVLVFCGYIGYDWAKANALPKTVDNAIDSAAELYIDIVNIFLRVLRILARAQKN
ncbi:MAG: Bax inhibitor-1 family protein [Wujia sp.]